MPFPHPQSRKNHDRNEDKPGLEGVAWQFVKGTVNITEYRDGKNDVNPAKNRSCDDSTRDVSYIGCCRHDVTPQIWFFCFVFFPDPDRFTSFELPEATSLAF